jgi:hypothetical protein
MPGLLQRSAFFNKGLHEEEPAKAPPNGFSTGPIAQVAIPEVRFSGL